MCSYYKTELDLNCGGSASKTYVDLIKCCTNIALRTITSACRFEINDTIYRENMLLTVVDETQKFDRKHETGLDDHVNTMAIQLLDIRCLDRWKPFNSV